MPGLYGVKDIKQKQLLNGFKMTKTIEIPKNMYDNLIVLAKEYATQNNRGTANPVYFSIESTISIPAFQGCGDYTEYRLDSETAITCLKDIESYLYDDNELINEEMNADYNKLKDINEDIGTLGFAIFMEEYLPDFEEISYSYDKVYDNCFLTAKACEEHIHKNHYHYNEPKSYAKYGWRNPELELIGDLLMYLGKLKNER